MYRKHTLALLFLGAGLMLLALSTLGIYPMAHLARTASSDGQLSEPFLGLVRQSQVTMALVLLATAALAPFAMRLWSLSIAILTRPTDRVFSLFCSLVAVSMALCVQFVLFDNMPHVTDAISHLFQAKIITGGRVYADAPPCPEAFFQPHVAITTSGKWFSKYTPGHPLLLACAMKLGLLWAVVPAFSGLAAVLIHVLARRFFGPMVGRTASLLFAVSPLAALLGGSFMSHTTFLVFGLLAIYFLLAAMDSLEAHASPLAHGLAAGFFFGWAAITRPHEFLMLGAMLAIGLSAAHVPLATLLRLAAPMAAGALPHVLLQGYWNMALYGHIATVGYGFTSTDFVRPMYQGRFGFGPEFGPGQAIRILLWTMTRFNAALLGWPLSLFFIPMTFLRRQIDRRDLVCLLSAAVVIGVYFFYDYYGMEYEARYYYCAAPLCMVLVVRGLQRVAKWISLIAQEQGNPFVLLLAVAFALHGLTFYWPARICPTYAGDYEQASPDLQRAVERVVLSRAIVLVPSGRGNEFRYSSGFAFMDPSLESEVIYARDIPETYRCLSEAFPDRTLYRYVDGDRVAFEMLNPAAP